MVSFKKKIVSSAYAEAAIIKDNNISNAKINKNAEIGSP